MGNIHLVLGGSRSGKSHFAEHLAAESGRVVVYMATCRTQSIDTEMKTRIEKHRARRPDDWETVENNFDLVHVAEGHGGCTLLLDCLTLWLADAMETSTEEGDILRRLETGLQAFIREDLRVIIVSNELGMGLVPLGEQTRAYRDLVGSANQLVAQYANHVDFIVSGQSLRIK